MEAPLISIIVPVYNVEKYIEKSILSIMNQTYSNLEIVLVNDGSTDKSGIICDEFQKKDKRIRVIHKKNGGLSDARNIVLDGLKSQYVTFIDSDDYVSNDYIQYLYDLIKKNNADISICQLKKIYQSSEELDRKKEYVEVLDNRSAIKNFLYQRKFMASAHCKLYKSELFADIRYPKGYYYEDMAVICKLLDKTKVVVVSNQQKYYYVQRNDSIMGEKFNLKKMHRVKVAKELQKYINENYPDLLDAANARYFLATVQTFREIPYQEECMKYIDEVWKEIKIYRKGVILDKNTKKTIKIVAISSFFGKKVMYILGLLYTRLC